MRMVFGVQPASRKFEPPSPLIPPRTWSNGPIYEQPQSVFLGQIPAEIRNEIYRYVFDTKEELEQEFEGDGVDDEYLLSRLELKTCNAARGDDAAAFENPSHGEMDCKLILTTPVAHPLSLLLTCRMVNREATILAFSLYTFVAPRSLGSYHQLRTRTSPLSSAQLSAITSVAQDFNLAGTCYFPSETDFIANSLLLFPSVTTIEVRAKRHIPGPTNSIHSNLSNWLGNDMQKPNRVPLWLWYAVMRVVRGTSVRWQAGQTWSVQWPQQDEHTGMGSYIDAIFEGSGADAAAAAMKNVEGIEACICGDGEPSWLAADLVQETGRKVRLNAVYYGNLRMDQLRELRRHRVKLVPGVNRLPITSLSSTQSMCTESISTARGFGWDVDEKYWEKIRKRKLGFLGSWMYWMAKTSNEKVGPDTEPVVRMERGTSYGEVEEEDAECNREITVEEEPEEVKRLGFESDIVPDSKTEPEWWKRYWRSE
jgi:hypothetical protein